MSKEIKEKCKECVYYNEGIEYPIVDGTTTHSNCMSIKCGYHKVTKDLKIVRLKNKIADLESKLAESEKERELDNSFWKQECDSLQKTLAEKDKRCKECKHLNKKIELNIKNKLMNENAQLKQQLTEKEKEYKESVEKILSSRDKFVLEYTQDKISFAVAYLEIIKAFIIDKEFYFIGEDYSTVYVEDITEEIDNQIKQLKEGK